MRDIETRADIEVLMNAFYEKAMKDEVIGFIFTDVAKLDLKHHIPIITDFWENVLFNSGSYVRNAMAPHFMLNAKEKFVPQYFDRWLQLFTETVHQNFSGARAELACNHANSIAAIMKMKMNQVNEGKLH
jgi:hemoglobin